MNLIRLVFVLTVSLGLFDPRAWAAETAEEDSAKSAEETSALMNWAMQDYLLGDWAGYRTRLKERGVDFEFVYFASGPWNLAGGIETGLDYQGALLLTLDLDSEKLAGYPGGHLHVGGLYLHGEHESGFATNHIGDFNKANLIDFPESARLWELWYEQKLLEEKLSLKVGQLAVDGDFVKPEFYNQMGFFQFLNQTFFFPTLAFNVWDAPPIPTGSHALASTPYGALGARLRVDPAESFYVQAAVYDGYPDVLGDGTAIKLHSEEGALAYFEMGYKLNQGEADTGLPGNYKLGAFYHTDDFYDMESVVFALSVGGSPTTHSGNYGGYFLADQMLYLENGRDDPALQGLAGFFRLAAAPPDRNLTQFEIDGGLLYRGPFAGRDWDSVGVAASYLEMSDDIGGAMQTVNGVFPSAFPVLPDYEGVVEVNYRAQMTAWWSLHTSLQRVFHPGGHLLVAPKDSWALVLMSTLRF